MAGNRTTWGLLAAMLGLGLGLAVFRVPPDRAVKVEVKVPPLSALAVEGQALFADNCQGCHGDHAAGSDNGPPLIHRIYAPGHHADAAFELAALRGVTSHHWNFGDMPPIPDVSQPEVTRIVRYIRELQRANGIR